MSDQTLAKKFIQPNINHQSEIMFGDQIAESINYESGKQDIKWGPASR